MRKNRTKSASLDEYFTLICLSLLPVGTPSGEAVKSVNES